MNLETLGMSAGWKWIKSCGRYDVARKKWGSTWRLPTKVEFDELLHGCAWQWTTLRGKNGYKVTSKKNGNSIFLPAAGWYYDTRRCGEGENCYYWSSTPDDSKNKYACFWALRVIMPVLVLLTATAVTVYAL
jgi:uncharacterized protein (TIGR02145 family)